MIRTPKTCNIAVSVIIIIKLMSSLTYGPSGEPSTKLYQTYGYFKIQYIADICSCVFFNLYWAGLENIWQRANFVTKLTRT